MIDIGMDIDGSCYREIITWALFEISAAQTGGMIDGRLASQ